MKRVFVSSDDELVKNMFRERGFEVVKNFFDDFDVICFTGGADINPFLYGERPLPETEFSTRRDNIEIRYWKSLESSFPKVGICRGAQLGNVLCGGTLWQDVDGHQAQHPVKDYAFSTVDKPRYVPVSSVHHQMCILTDDALLYATASRALKKQGDGHSKRYGIQTGVNIHEDVEAFYYSNFNFLGVQFHPEYYGYKACREYFWELFDASFKSVSQVQEKPATRGVLAEQLSL